MDVFTAMRRRRSIREFTGEKIPDEDIEAILDAARYAPSPENMQMWKYIVIREDHHMKKLLAELCQLAAQELFASCPAELTLGRLWYIPDSRKPATFEEMRDGSLFAYPEKADTAIIGCGSEHFIDSPLKYPQEFFGSICMGMGIIQMWLAATALGYGVGYQALPIMDSRRAEILCDELGIPPTWKPLATIFIGVPAGPRMVGPSRWPFEGHFYAERWGNPYVRKIFRDRGVRKW